MSWKAPISTSVLVSSRPCSTAPLAAPRWTASTSPVSSAPTWLSNTRISSIQASSVPSGKKRSNQAEVRSGAVGHSGPIERFGRPGFTLNFIAGKRMWYCAVGTESLTS